MADGGDGRRKTQAQRADRHRLYEASVQSAEQESVFVRDLFRELRGRVPYLLREDFCGTANFATAWAALGPSYRAIGVDLDPAVLEWAERNRMSQLAPAHRRRIELVNANVLDARTGRVDALCAFNFSYWVFKKRADLLAYFRRAREALKSDGIFFLDAFGGYDAYRVLRESTPHRGFTYVWHQERYSPVTGEILCHIHFRFPDGSRLQKAFTYDWRLWSLPELREILEEAGFRRVTVYWEGDGEDGGGNGEFTPEAAGEADAGWVAYLVAER